ncbi:Pentatricopeptide repeat [Macleaya cordata]|uniref:Pentatricopeptide repeat n=1 Tax=Macleaya cordata TaxID=56857 RepID=A0A200PRY1_MACCD|nr:Pentatricopeptide repeat [Macleaya cordata]
MALSKPTFFTHLKTLTKPHYHLRHQPPYFLSLRLLSFATPEEAAAERRRRKRRLRMEPPQNSLRQSQVQRRPQTPISNPNPNAPKLPEHVSILTGNRLNLHNRILSLIRQNDLEEAALLTRHSIYSNCRPTIFTCNSVMAAQIRQSKYADFLSLHRFITQAGVVPNIITYNLLINAYCDCRKIDTALEHYRQLINNAPFNPSPTTYRILVKGLVDNSKVDQAISIKDEMLEKGLGPDPVVYNYLMLGLVKNQDSDGVLGLYDELKGKLGDVSDGIVYGSLMKAYFQKGMEKEAMECCDEAVGENSKVRMGAVAYNSILDALSKNGKFDEAMKLFERVMNEHNPPRRLTVNLGTFNVMADGFCAQGRFKDAIEVFRKMGEKRCTPDAVSFNNLIEQLCGNSMVAEAEELYREMSEKGVSPDEFTYVLLMDACFVENRAEDASGYFRKMVESGLRPNLVAFGKVIDGLINSGKIDEAKEFFDQMVEKLKPEVTSYEAMLRTLCEAGKLDEVLKMAGDMWIDDSVGLSLEMKEYVSNELRKEGREEELVRLLEEKEREKEENERRKAEAKEAEAQAAKAITAGSKGYLSKVTTVDIVEAGVESVTVNGDVAVGNQEDGTGEDVAVEVEDAITSDDLTEEVKPEDKGTVDQVTA